MDKNNKKILPLIITVLTIFFNYYLQRQSDKSIGEVSDENNLLVTPAGWTFSIWGLIYSSLIYLSYEYIQEDLKWSDRSLLLYSLSGFFNVYWIILWLQEKTKLSQYILYSISASLYLLWNDNVGKQDKKIYQNIIAMYLAWTLGASIINTGINAKKQSDKSELSDIKISKNIIYSICSVQVLWQIILDLDKNNDNDKNLNKRKESIALPIVGIWTSLGILTNEKKFDNTFKILPLIISSMSTKYHLNKIGIKSNNLITIINKLKEVMINKKK